MKDVQETSLSLASLDIRQLVAQILELSDVRELGPNCSIQFFPEEEKLTDSPLKFLISSPQSCQSLFGMCAPPMAPEFVARAGERACAVKQLLSPSLASAVVTPIRVERVSGRSFALYPLLRPLSSHQVWGPLQRRMYRGSILEWLHRAAEETSASASGEVAISCCEAVSQFPGISQSLSKISLRAIQAIQNGLWEPRHCLAHNDLWSGNIMLDTSERRLHSRFRIIDWAGATLKGFPGFDLIRLLNSFCFSRALGRRALNEHAQIFSWSTQELGFSLIAGLGRIACDLQYFPPQRFLHMAEQCAKRFVDISESSR